MSVLVATASRHGATHEIGEIIAEAIRQADIGCERRNVESIASLDGYQAVVLGSAVYAGSWLREATRFVDRFGEELLEIPVWVFSSGPLGDPLEPSDCATDPAIVAAVAAVDSAVFGGMLKQGDLGPVERIMVKAFGAPEGDFRDLHQITSWADEISIRLFKPENASLLDAISGTSPSG